MERTINIPALQIRASVVPSTYDKRTHRVDIVWSTGSRTLVTPFFEEPFLEELGLNADEVRLERFENGAPLLDSHGEPKFRMGGTGLKDVLGVIREASVDGTHGHGVVEFSQRKEMLERGIEKDVADGILCNFSIGYRVYRYRDITTKDDPVRVLRAVDWEPYEASLLPVADDIGARTRALPELNPCVLEGANEGATMAQTSKKKKAKRGTQAGTGGERTRGIPVDPQGGGDGDGEGGEGDGEGDGDGEGGEGDGDGAQRQRSGPGAGDPNPPADPAPAPVPVGGDQNRGVQPGQPLTQADIEAAAARAIQADRVRANGITLAFRSGNLGEENDEAVLIQQHIDSNTPLDQVRAIALEMISRHQDQAPTRSGVRVGEEEGDKRYRGMQDALEHRVDAVAELTEDGQGFRNMSLLRMAEEVLLTRGLHPRGMSPNQLAIRALAVSDFPQILANVANKVMARAYAVDERTFTLWARRSEIPDFKPKSIVQFGSVALEEVSDTGEIRAGTVGEKGESYFLATYAKRLPFTRKAIVNDDAGAFDRIPRMFGQAAARTESDLVYAIFSNNPLMAEDGVALFDAAHGNDRTDALDLAGLSNGRADMRKQLDLNGQRINISPRYLIVNPDLETTAQQLTTQTTPAGSADVNPFVSQFRAVVVEPRLVSATEWYMSSSPDAVDTIEYAFLRGESGPRIESEEGFETDGTQWRVVHDFGVGVLDFRGLYRGNV